METAVTFATSDVDKLNSIKDFIRSLNVSIIQEEDIPQPIEMTPRLVAFLDKATLTIAKGLLMTSRPR